MKRFWQTAVVMFFTADAILLLLFARRWVRFTRFGHPSSSYYKTMTWFLQWPEWLLRLLGLVEGGLAYVLFTRLEPPEQR